jgi:urease accessory protein
MIPAPPPSSPSPLALTRRLGPGPAPTPLLRLALDAAQRTSLRGRRRSVCGRELVLQLPRGEALHPGELLAGEAGPPLVRVEAAPEPLLRVTGQGPLALLQAAYHLGNRHVAIEIHPQELRLLHDPVLAHLLEHRGLTVAPIEAPFQPEPGAYGEGPSHAHGHHP